MRLGVLMDPLEHLNIKKDSTLAMIEAATALNWSCAYFTLQDIFCRDGQAFAHTTEIAVDEQVLSKSIGEQPLAVFDIILMRKDPPFNLEYIYATYALDLAEKQGVLVANRPQSLRDANEKFFTLNFADCCPPSLVSSNIEQLKQFWKTHCDVIFKPLEGMGGRSVFRVNHDAYNLTVILEQLTRNGECPIMAQRYISDIVKTGDKRILLINGEPIEYALARIPQPGELRGNLAAGGRGEVVVLSENDRVICEKISPTLKAKGLYFVGIDVIGNYLTEINVTSPTCIREIEAEKPVHIAKKYLQMLANQI